MTTDLESSVSVDNAETQAQPTSWLKVGLVAAGSALVGGLAAAWYYRNTLTKLRQAEGHMQNSESGRPGWPTDPEG